jgi:general secretion pathway protein J
LSIQCRQYGLSLLELLVVFVIISMISSVLAQGLGFGLALYDRVENRGRQIERDVLSSHWFRQVNGSLMALSEPGQSLIGDREGFFATTINPLLAAPGIPARIKWSILNGELIYEEGDQVFPAGRLLRSAELRYLNRKGQWLESWPEDPNSYELPGAIKVAGVDHSIFFAAVKVRLKPDLVREELRRELE